MIAKDDYSTTSPLNEGATVDNLQPTGGYINSPFGNVKLYDLDAEIPPIERVQIEPNVPNLAPSIPANTPAIETTTDTTIAESTIAPITATKKPNYVLYGVGALALGLVAYKLLKK
jgi:hypothetical protein